MILFQRSIKAQSIIELITGILVAIPAFFVLFDLAIIVIAVQINDNIAKNACRIASQGDPITAQARALTSVIQASKGYGSLIKSPKLANYITNLTSNDISTWQKTGGIIVHYTGSGSVPGEVSITTSIEIQPFIIPWFISGGKNFVFKASQKFPFSYASYDPASTANPWLIPNSSATYAEQQ